MKSMLFDSRMIRDSGIGVYIQNVLPRLIEQNIFDFSAITLNGVEWNYPSSVSKILFNAGIYSIKEQLEFYKLKGSYDLLWSPHYNVPVSTVKTKTRIVMIHDVFHLAFYKTLSIGQKAYASFMINHAVKASDIIFTVSNYSKQEIVKYTSCNADKIKVVYNGIDFNRFNNRSSDNNRRTVFDKYHLHSPYVLFVGNVKPHKNLKTALLGFKLAIEKTGLLHSNVGFVIVGKRDGFITADLEVGKLLSESFFKEKVVFTGWVEDADLPTIYQNAATFIFPSIYEGFGFPPLEAMAAGCPVISSNTACMPEIYQDAAVFFDPYKPAEISDALVRILADSYLRNDLIEKGLRQAKKYNWDSAVQQKLSYIQERS